MKNLTIVSLLLTPLLTLSLFSTASAQLTDNITDTTASTCVNLTKDMRSGSKDSTTDGQVSDLQFFLNDKGYLKTDPTGYFGAATLVAVKAFQADNGVSQTGNVGPLTRSKISSVSCSNDEPVSINTIDQLPPTTFGNLSVGLSFQSTASPLPLTQATIGGIFPNVNPLIPRTWTWYTTGAASVSARYTISGANCAVSSFGELKMENWQPWVGSNVTGNRFAGSNTRTLNSTYYGCTIKATFTARNTQNQLVSSVVTVVFADQGSVAQTTGTCNGVQEFVWRDPSNTTVTTNGVSQNLYCSAPISAAAAGTKLMITATKSGQLNGSSGVYGVGEFPAECVSVGGGTFGWKISPGATSKCAPVANCPIPSGMNVTAPPQGCTVNWAYDAAAGCNKPVMSCNSSQFVTAVPVTSISECNVSGSNMIARYENGSLYCYKGSMACPTSWVESKLTATDAYIKCNKPTTTAGAAQCDSQYFQWADNNLSTVTSGGQTRQLLCSASIDAANVGTKTSLTASNGGQVTTGWQYGFGGVTAECSLINGVPTWKVSSSGVKTCLATSIGTVSTTTPTTPTTATTTPSGNVACTATQTAEYGSPCSICPSGLIAARDGSCTSPRLTFNASKVYGSSMDPNVPGVYSSNYYLNWGLVRRGSISACSASGGWTGGKDTSSFATVPTPITQDKVYSLTCGNETQSVTLEPSCSPGKIHSSITGTCVSPASSCTDNQVSINGTCQCLNAATGLYGACVAAQTSAPIVSNFSYTTASGNASPAPGENITFTWSATGSSACQLAAFQGGTSYFNLYAISPFTKPAESSGTVTYRLVCSNSVGVNSSPLTKDITVSGGNQSVSPTVSLTVSPSSQVTYPTNIVYSLTSTNSQSCEVTGGGKTYVNWNSNTTAQTVQGPTGPGTYTFSAQCASGYSGSGTKSQAVSATVTVACPSGSVPSGDGATCVGVTYVPPTVTPTANIYANSSTVTYPNNVVYTLSSSGSGSCQVTGSDGRTYVTWGENTTSKVVQSVTTPGTLTLYAQCASGPNGTGEKSFIRESSVTVSCVTGKTWNGSDCVISQASQWCTVSLSSTNFFTTAPMTASYQSTGMSSIEFSLDGGAYRTFVPTTGSATNGSQTFGATSIPPATYTALFRGIPSGSGAPVSCSPSTITFTSKP